MKKHRNPQIKLPDWLDPKLWELWKEHRSSKAMAAPMSPYAMELCIKRLGKLKDAGYDPKAVIEQSIEMSWTGLFPVKEMTVLVPQKPKMYRPMPKEEPLTPEQIARSRKFVEELKEKVAKRLSMDKK